MNSTVINTKIGEIEYCSVGQGIPIVFIHGGHSNCFDTLSHKGFDLSKFQLITPSRPGYGKTPLNGHRAPKQAAELIAELLNCLPIKPAIVYGISAGGLTAIELAAQHADKVQKLILASAISKKWLAKDNKIYKTAQIIFNPKIERVTWGMVSLFSKLLPRIIANSFYPQFSTFSKHHLKQEDIQELISVLKHYRSKSGFLNDVDQDICETSLEKIECPSLIIHSKYDNSVSIEHAINAKEKIHNSQFVELDNKWGHLFWIGKASEQAVMKTIEFINE
jgi:pimeloyl-ACP methyl ester carboxylesterase